MKEIKGISASTLKIIAMISMLTDHTAIVFFKDNLQVYSFMRLWIGRMAFPIFCFLLVEGLLKTRNPLKYAGRLLGFALLSELPQDIVLYGSIPDWKHQNVLFTLFIGLLMLWGMEQIQRRIKPIWLQWFLMACVFGVAAMVAQVTFCNYKAKGIAAIALLYLFRRSKWEQSVALCAAFFWEPTAMLAVGAIAPYNGKRGLTVKYLFYFFYPVHLMILYLLSAILK